MRTSPGLIVMRCDFQHHGRMGDAPKSGKVPLVERARQFRREATASESLLWNVLRARKLDGLKVRRQHRIENFIVDFFCAKLKLIVEIDGSIHDTQTERDEQRQRIIEQLGYTFLRVSATEVEEDIGSVKAKIRLRAQELGKG